MKKTAITLFCSLWLPLQAQFTGGSGDGDFKSGTGSKLLNGSSGTAAWYFGGNGEGDIKASVTTKQLDGTTAVLVWFYGGSGDGDNRSRGSGGDAIRGWRPTGEPDEPAELYLERMM